MNNFYKQDHCERCHKRLRGSRRISFLNDDCICRSCSEKELGLNVHDLSSGERFTNSFTNSFTNNRKISGKTAETLMCLHE